MGSVSCVRLFVYLIVVKLVAEQGLPPTIEDLTALQ
jgi:hypothetical protein